MRGAIYARRSNRRDDSTSIEGQVDACRRLAETDGVPVDEEDIFIDASVSGAKLDRPGWLALKARLPNLSHVYMVHPDRLARDRNVAGAIREAIEDAGVTLRLLTADTSELDYEARQIVEPVMDGMAAAVRSRTLKVTWPGRRTRVQAGLHPGKLPVGWKHVRNDRGRAVGVEALPEWDKFYEDLERLFVAGTPYNSLPKRMYELGHGSPYPDKNGRTGNPWPHTSLRDIIRNPWNAGVAVFGKRHRGRFIDKLKLDTAKLEAPASVPPRWKDTSAVRAEIARRSTHKGRGRWQRSRFAGLLYCSGCGGKMTTLAASGGKYRRYVCHRHRLHNGVKGHDCKAPAYIREDEAVRQLAVYLSKAAKTPGAMEAILARLQAERPNGYNAAELSARQKKVEAELATLVGRLGIVPASAVGDVTRRLEELAAERDGLTKALDEMARLSARRLDVDAVRRRLTTLAGLADTLGALDAPAFNAMLLGVIPGGLMVVERTLIFRATEEFLALMKQGEDRMEVLSGLVDA